MSQFLHNLGFGKECLRLHRAWFQSFYGYGCGTIPRTSPHFAKHSLAQFLPEVKGPPRNFPGVLRTISEPSCIGFLRGRASPHQHTTKAVGLLRVMGDQFVEVWIRRATRYVITTTVQPPDPIVFHHIALAH